MAGLENAGKCREGFAYIPGGTFKMGSEKGDLNERPVRDTTVSAMCMKQSEVTIGEYDGSKKGALDIDFPATDVNWEYAQKYCNLIGGRLPTEAEWEYAARGGTENEYGTISGDLRSSETRSVQIKIFNPYDPKNPYTQIETTDLAHYGQKQIAKVCSYPENPFGLCDMLGNVYEWVEDRFEKGEDKVLRGASWLVHDKYFLRAANRAHSDPDIKSDSIGFRCVMMPK